VFCNKNWRGGRRTVYPAKIQKLVDTFFTSPGRTTPALRRAIEAHGASLAGGERKDEGPVPEELATYMEKVVLYTYKTMDEDVDEMKRAGYSEDEIFEITLSATLGPSLARLERGLALLDGGE
jgi:hypothetical protein